MSGAAWFAVAFPSVLAAGAAFGVAWVGKAAHENGVEAAAREAAEIRKWEEATRRIEERNRIVGKIRTDSGNLLLTVARARNDLARGSEIDLEHFITATEGYRSGLYAAIAEAITTHSLIPSGAGMASRDDAELDNLPTYAALTKATYKVIDVARRPETPSSDPRLVEIAELLVVAEETRKRILDVTFVELTRPAYPSRPDNTSSFNGPGYFGNQ
ncbi:hypothetical protein [Streptomyces sp. RK9]|uniref:hypothetical protein n=1 Tax=Streptomyces sp. RK9 TaxID=3239284 RepID=UPI003864DF77